MRRTPFGAWTAAQSVAAGRALSCPPARVAEVCAVETVVGTVDEADPPAARVVASIRMTGATSVAAEDTTRGTAAAMGEEVAVDADVKDPAAAVLVRVHANCAPVRAATAVELPGAVAVTVTPAIVAPGPRHRLNAIEPRHASVRSAVATPSHLGALFRRPVPAAGPELPGRCPDLDPGRTVATETPTTIRWTATYTHNVIMTN